MHFELSKPQRLLQQSARTFFQRECPLTRVRKLMETDGAWDPALWNGLAEQGWTGLMIPEEHEGIGLGAVDLAALGEELGRACLPGPFLSTTWAASLIQASGNPAFLSEHLQPIAAGTRLATVALLDSESSWDPAQVQLTAEPSKDTIELRGCKRLVLDAKRSDLILCAVRLEGELAIVAIKADDARLIKTTTRGIDQTRWLYQIELDGVRLGPDQILARGETALKALERSIDTGTILVCAELIGGMQWVLETTVEYAKTRQQFDKPIGSFQSVQHQCADMLLLLESARAATYYAAWTLDQDAAESARAVSVAKAYCSDAAREVGNRGIQVHGGIGFTWEHDLHLFYRRAKAGELMFGDATYHRERLARLIIPDPR